MPAHPTRIPIIIAVTGHRDLILDDEELLRDRIQAIFTYFRKQYPSSPIKVLSALAVGADRLVAEIAITLRDRGDNLISVVAPLPLPVDLYEQDFGSPIELNQFRDLLSKMDEWFVLDSYVYDGFDHKKLELPTLNQRTRENNWGYSAERNAQYANVGVFMAKHANVLIALWDGKICQNTAGGTSNIVGYMLNGEMDWGGCPPRHEFLECSNISGGEYGVVIHIHVDRVTEHSECMEISLQDQKDTSDSAWRGMTLLDHINWYFTGDFFHKSSKTILDQISAYQREEFYSSLQKIESFNQDVERAEKSGILKVWLLKSWLTSGKSNQLESSSTPIKILFHVADAMSQHYQWKAKLMLAAVFTSLFLLLVSFEGVQYYGPGGGTLGYASFVFFLGAAIFLAGFLTMYRTGKYKQKTQDYRTLAEALRVFFYLECAHLNKQLAMVYAMETRDRTAWIDQARWSVEIHTWSDTFSEVKTDIEQVKYVHEIWIKDQISYFEKKLSGSGNRSFLGIDTQVSGLRQKTGLLTRLQKAAYFITGLALLVISWFYLTGNINAATYVIFPVGLLVVTESVKEWANIIGYDDDTKRYTFALDMFRRADYELSVALTAGNINKAVEIIKELAIEALSENAKWHETHSSKDIGTG